MDADRRAKRARNRRRIERLQLTQPGGREVAGDAAHTEAVSAVRRHLDVEDRVAETGIARVPRSQRRILRQLDDPLVVVAETELIGRAQHAARGDAADYGLAQQ